jgi:chemotaxis methyl-accepting protein methylase
VEAARWNVRIRISRFYRDREVWRLLEREILPQLAAQASSRGENRLRIWCAGCASGEESYTLALVFAFAEVLKDCKPEIMATDADLHLLARASRACYAPSNLRELPKTWRAAFGQTDGGVLSDFTPPKSAKSLASTRLDDDFGFHMDGYILTSNQLNICSCSSVGVPFW